MATTINSGWFYGNEPLYFEGDDYITIEAFRAAVKAYDAGDDIPFVGNQTLASSFLDQINKGVITRTRMPQ